MNEDRMMTPFERLIRGVRRLEDGRPRRAKPNGPDLQVDP